VAPAAAVVRARVADQHDQTANARGVRDPHLPPSLLAQSHGARGGPAVGTHDEDLHPGLRAAAAFHAYDGHLAAGGPTTPGGLDGPGGEVGQSHGPGPGARTQAYAVV